MGLLQGFIVITVITLVGPFVAATELHCFIGEDICGQWQNEAEAEHGQFNGKVVCCPPEPHQVININGFLDEPDNCICQEGTAEKYKNVGSSATTPTPAVAICISFWVVCLAALVSPVFTA